MKIFALYGLKGSGRDSAARILKNIAEKAQKSFYQTSFSNRARFCIMDCFLMRNEYEFENFKHGTITMPDGRIVSGKSVVGAISEHMRQLNSEMFVDDVDYTIRNLENKENRVVVINDLKFKDELKWCKENDVVVIKIKREGVFEERHLSEREIDDFLCDYVIENNGYESELEEQLQYIYDKS